MAMYEEAHGRPQECATLAVKLSDVKYTAIKTERAEGRSRRSGEGRVMIPNPQRLVMSSGRGQQL